MAADFQKTLGLDLRIDLAQLAQLQKIADSLNRVMGGGAGGRGRSAGDDPATRMLGERIKLAQKYHADLNKLQNQEKADTAKAEAGKTAATARAYADRMKHAQQYQAELNKLINQEKAANARADKERLRKEAEYHRAKGQMDAEKLRKEREYHVARVAMEKDFARRTREAARAAATADKERLRKEKEYHAAKGQMDRETQARERAGWRDRMAMAKAHEQALKQAAAQRPMAQLISTAQEGFGAFDRTFRGITRYWWIIVGFTMTIQRFIKPAEDGLRIILQLAERGARALIALGQQLMERAGLMESLQARAAAVYGGEAGGQRVLGFAVDVALRLPQTIDDITQALIRLQATGVNAVAGMGLAFKASTDLAIIFKKNIDDAARVLQQWYAGYSTPAARTFGITPQAVVPYGAHLKKGGVGLETTSMEKRADNLMALIRYIEARYSRAAEQMLYTIPQLLSKIGRASCRERV